MPRSRSFEDRLFPLVLALSVALHFALPMLRTASAIDRPDFEVEERIAAEPMTVRILQPPVDPPPQLPPSPTESLLTSEDGARSVQSIEAEPVEFERNREEPPPPERVLPEPEALPEPVVEPLVEPLPPAPPPPEPEPLPEVVKEPKPTPPPAKDTALPAGPVEQESQSGVISRAVQKRRGNRAPNYPRRARATKQQGTTKLEVYVRADGTVEKLSVFESSGFSLLDDEALKAVKRWRFTPARSPSGAPTEDRVIVPVVFKLR